MRQRLQELRIRCRLNAIRSRHDSILLHRGCGRLHRAGVGGRAMLDIIGIKALVARPAVDDARDFPGQIVQILHHCPHAEAAGGRQLVGGVAGE